VQLIRPLAALLLTIAVSVACSPVAEDEGAMQSSVVSVPSVPLPGDRSKCRGDYLTRAPVAGQNTNYAIDDQARDFYLMFPPAAARSGEPRPLLVAFNGTGDDGGGMISWARLADFAARGFIVLAPSSIGNGTIWPVWDALRQPGTESEPNKDLDYFDSLLDCVASYYPVDKNRVYVGGYSAGGMMANYVLQRRSSLLAGGIVSSGTITLTSPKPAKTLDPMFVVVTWGGNNDQLGDDGLALTFSTEAALATQFYDAAPNVTEVNCRGADVGHEWLWRNNPYLIDLLLAHPKGEPALTGPLPPVPPDAKASCSDVPYAGPPAPVVSCPTSTTTGCSEVCQFIGDCTVENTMIEPLLHRQLATMGFSGNGDTQCGGCVTQCEAHGSTADSSVRACLAQRHATARCTQGLGGVYPFVDAVNDCCRDRSDSALCVDMCRALLDNPVTPTFFPTCQAIVTP
jgi:predicted esterase